MEQSEESQEKGRGAPKYVTLKKEKWWCGGDAHRERKWGKILKKGEAVQSIHAGHEREREKTERARK